MKVKTRMKFAGLAAGFGLAAVGVTIADDKAQRSDVGENDEIKTPPQTTTAELTPPSRSAEQEFDFAKLIEQRTAEEKKDLNRAAPAPGKAKTTRIDFQKIIRERVAQVQAASERPDSKAKVKKPEDALTQHLSKALVPKRGQASPELKKAIALMTKASDGTSGAPKALVSYTVNQSGQVVFLPSGAKSSESKIKNVQSIAQLLELTAPSKGLDSKEELQFATTVDGTED